jgi:hypothetical protein
LIPADPPFAKASLGSDGGNIAQLEAATSAIETAQQAASQNCGYQNQRRSHSEAPKSLPPVYSSAEQTMLRVGVPEDGIENVDFNSVWTGWPP